MTDYSPETDVMGDVGPSNSSYQVLGELVCGAVAGAMGIFVGVPFDFVKVRMQTYSHLYKSSWDCFRTSIKTDGIFGLYRGCSAPIAAQGGVNALLFAGESFAMRLLEPELKSGQNGNPVNVFLAGSFGGLLQCLIMVPSDVIKCNMQVGTLAPEKSTRRTLLTQTYRSMFTNESLIGKNASKYSGVVDCISQLYRKEGIKGFYRGFFVTSLREIPSLGVYFSVYRHSKHYLTSIGLDVHTLVPLVSGALAGSVSWAMIYPIDVVKSNIQVDTIAGIRPTTSMAMIFHLHQKYGLSIFFRGFSTTVIRAIPVNATTFYFYEYFKKSLGLW